jgi:hypothetical protein
MPLLPPPLLEVCHSLASLTYENLSKLRGADPRETNTCFGWTWRLYQKIQSLGFAPRLLMGHKRQVPNVHCALLFSYAGADWFVDPGYLLFEPLAMPQESAFYPLVPNWARLEREAGERLALFTGCGSEKPRFRFAFDLAGVSEDEFHAHWEASYFGESMNCVVFNRLDLASQTQYYYQQGKTGGNLLIRSPQGATQKIIAENEQKKMAWEVFGVEV